MSPTHHEPPPLPRITWSLVAAIMFMEFVAIAVVAGLIVTATGISRPNLDNVSDDVRRELDDQVAGWNRGDMDRYLETYWNDDRLMFYSGNDMTTGWEATRTRYNKRYRAEGKEMGRLAFESVEVLPLGPDDALARGRWALHYTSQKSDGGLFTLLLKKKDGKWRIVHDHTSAKPPPTAPTTR